MIAEVVMFSGLQFYDVTNVRPRRVYNLTSVVMFLSFL